MEPQDFYQFSAANSSLSSGQHSDLFPSDPLQLPNTNLNQSGYFSDPMELGIAEAAAEMVVEYDQSVIPNVFGGTSVTGKASLDSAIATAQEQLELFATNDELLGKMNQAFGDDWHPESAHTLIQDLASGEAMPTIAVLPAADLKANGAFGEGTIYLSDKFLTDNADDPEVVAGVLLEELGHYVDQELASHDSPGDEGDIFARLVQDKPVTEAEFTALIAEDDHATISLNEKEIAVELAGDPLALAPIPPDEEINEGLTSPLADYLEELLGNPEDPNSEGQQLQVTQNVGPFEITGLQPAVEALGRIFDKVEVENPALYEQLGNVGMLNVRKIEGTDTYSNHSWGAAIDMRIGDTEADLDKNGETYQGLIDLQPYFNAEKFYWGAEFSTNEDPIHFEASEELLVQWENEGLLTPSAEPPTPPTYPGEPLEYVEGETLVYEESALQWQQRMQELDYDIDADGYYGPESRDACIAFQEAQGLTVDGIVGPETWEAVFSTDVVAPPPPDGIETGDYDPVGGAPEFVTDEFLSKVYDISQELEAIPEYLMAVMGFETGGSYDPAVQNPDSGATGLIQFLETTAANLGTSTAELASLTAVEQLDYVAEYFSGFAGSLTSLESTYLAVLYPAAIGQTEVFVAGSEDTGDEYEANAGLDTDGDGVVTAEETTENVREYLPVPELFAEYRA